MSKLSVTPVAQDDAKQNAYMQEFARRIEATPPGMCPVSMQLSLLQASGCQTCGKCTPCREGIPQLEGMLEAVLAFEGMPQMCFSKEWTRLLQNTKATLLNSHAKKALPKRFPVKPCVLRT